MDRLTEKHWRNLDPWECCGQDDYCKRGCHESGGCANGCIVPRLYDRLAAYEDTGLEPEEIMALTTPAPNPPLTMEELREMDGEPVWVVVEDVNGFSELIMRALVEVTAESVWLTNNLGGRNEYRFDEPIEDGIVLYRHKPEEDTPCPGC